jgi:hypothetical protein
MTGRILISATESWPSAAHYAAGLVVTGCEVAALAPASAPVLSNRTLAGRRTYWPMAPLRSLQAAIRKFSPDLIMCCDERALAHLLTFYSVEKETSPRLAALIERSLGNPESYARVLSRSTSLTELRELGLCVPETLAVEDEDDLDRSIAAVGYPAVLKADESWGGEGVRIVNSRKEARAAYRKLALAPSRGRSLARLIRRRDPHFLLATLWPKPRKVSVQRFITGRLAASAFVADRGRIAAFFSYDILESHDAGMGPPKLVRRIDCPEMEEAAHAVASRFELSGVHGMDFIRDEADRAHLIEINPRATQGGTLPFGPGRDIPYALASMLDFSPTGIREAMRTDFARFERKPSAHKGTETSEVPWSNSVVFRELENLP